jgi:hypothetical protein
MTNLTRKITLVLGLLTGPVVFTQASYVGHGPVPLAPRTLPPGGVAKVYFDGTGPVPLPPCWPCSQDLSHR